MIREIAEFDFDRAQAILRWPIREGLLKYVYLLRERARVEYWNSVLAWSPRSPYLKGETGPPKVPKILRAD